MDCQLCQLHRRIKDTALVVGLHGRYNSLGAALVRLHRLPGVHRCWRLGKQHSGRLGVGHHQLRVLDRHWPCGNADFRDLIYYASEMANLYQSGSRSDDLIRGHLRRDLSRFSYRPCLDGVVLAPVPNSNGIWQNFRSPLLWDVFAVGTYFTVSVLFWYTGLIPDLATLRDRATTKIRKFAYGILALGWRGSNRHWRHYEMAYLLLAGLSTPLVLSVHSVVSFDFSTSVVPGWHTTIFPPYFVAGAIFGGFAMVLTIMIPACALYKPLHDLVTISHVDKMCKVIVLTGSIVGYAYLMELFMAWYSGNPIRARRVLVPGDRALLVGIPVHDVLQCRRPATLLVQIFSHPPGLGVDHCAVSECGNVV